MWLYQHRKRKATSDSEPSSKKAKDSETEDNVSFSFSIDSLVFYSKWQFSNIEICLFIAWFSPDAVEVAKTSKAPKDKERQKKRKQETSKTVVETISIEGSPDKANVRKKKHGHKDSNPNSAYSCLETTFQRYISNKLVRLIWISFLFKITYSHSNILLPERRA